MSKKTKKKKLERQMHLTVVYNTLHLCLNLFEFEDCRLALTKKDQAYLNKIHKIMKKWHKSLNKD